MTTRDPPIITIPGTQVALGPLCRALLPAFFVWLNDLDVVRTWGVRKSPATAEQIETWYSQVTMNPQTVSFAVYERATGQPIGYTMLTNIDHFDRLADFEIILGAKESWGRGYGTETTRLILDYGFTILGLHNIMLTVRSYNERGIRAYTRAGFQPIGLRREARRAGGQAYDLIHMDCVATDFQSPVLHHLAPRSSASADASSTPA